MKTTRFLILALLVLSTLFLPNTFAQSVPYTTLAGHTSDVRSVVFSPDGRTLASGSEDNTIRLWDVASGTETHTLRGHTSDVRSVVFSPDGRTLASGSWDDTIRLWDAASGTETHTLEEHTDVVWRVVFSPDGRTLASGSWDDTIRLWDVASGTETHTLEEHTGRVWRVVFSPDGRTLASGSEDNTIRLWDVASGTETHTLEEHTDVVRSVVFSPNGRTLASRSDDNTIRLWDAVSGTETHTLEEHTDVVRSVVFSPDGRTLASGSDDNTIRLWDVASGTETHTLTLTHTLEGYTSDVWRVVFSPDGRTLASGSRDGTIRLWDAVSGTEIHTLERHWDSFSSVVFSPDGRTLASGSRDGTIRLWELPGYRIRITPDPVVSPAIGEQFTIDIGIVISIVAGENVGGYQVGLEFDATALRYVESANGDYLPAGAFFVPPVVEGDNVTLGAASLGGTRSGEGTLATLTFEVVDIKESSLRLFATTLTDGDGKRLPHLLRMSGLVIESQLHEDVNQDGVVNIQDLVRIAASFGQRAEGKVDVNGDGVVDVVDLVKVAGALGAEAGAPSASPQALEMLTAAEVQQWLTQAQALNLTDATSQRGILFLQQFLAALIPKETALLPNYPNPFNPETWIPYQLAEAADVRISIYAADGKLIRTLELGHQSVGVYESRSRAVYWDGKNELGESVASGVYFYTLTANDFTATRKMLIRK